MAVLQKIRDKAGIAVSIIIALALLLFIVNPEDIIRWFENLSSKNNVGVIAGKKISQADYRDEVDRFTDLHKFMTGSSVMDEEQQEQIRNTAWQNLLDRYMFIENARDAGICVGEEEIYNLLMGDNPSPLVASNPMFAGEDGTFSPDKIKEFVNNISSDTSGQLKLFWDYLQQSVTIQRYYQKYGALFSSASNLNALMLADEVEAGNMTANVDFVLKNFPMEEDSTIVVEPSAIKNFYTRHKKEYKCSASRDIEYVMFEVVPSQKDIDKNNLAFQESYEKFATADNMKAFILKHSDEPYSEYWYKKGELLSYSREIDDFIFGTEGGVSPVFTEGYTQTAAKTVETAMIPDSVYVKHILLQGDNAAATADSLLAELKNGGDFATAAASYSADKSSMADGQIGNIGWLTQTYMIPGFESTISAKVGVPYLINTMYGTHIVEVEQTSSPIVKKRVAILRKTAIASTETSNDYYAQASNFATLAGGTLEGYLKAVDSLKVYSRVQDKITEATSSYGSVEKAKEVTRWAFDAKKGKCSGIITVNQNFFFVVALKEIHKEGYTPIEEVEPMIKNHLYNELLAQKQCELVKEQINGLTDMEEIAGKLGTEVSNVADLSASTMGANSNEPALVGAARTAELGKIAGPVAGRMGIYVLKVNSRETGNFYTEDDARNTATQKTQYMARMIGPVMMEAADVKDNRARFY